jgi:hypothetical protein
MSEASRLARCIVLAVFFCLLFPAAALSADSSAPFSLSVTAFSDGPNFSSGNLYATASLTVKVTDANGQPVNGVTVTWTVLNAQNNSPAMMPGWESKKTGLTWGNVPEPSLSYVELQQERIDSSAYNINPADHRNTSTTNGAGETPAQQLTDIVGQRNILVQAKVTIGGTDYTATQTVSFGNGPLSVFSKVGTGTVQWSSNYTSDNSRSSSSSFQYAGNTFPAAAFCGGTVNNNVTTTGTATASDAGFDPNDTGWTGVYQPTGPSPAYAARYAANSKLATTDQLLAVSPYYTGGKISNPNTNAQGAAVAAGWLDASYWAWTGEVTFTRSAFFAGFVDLYYGSSYWLSMGPGSAKVVACVP